MSAGGAIGSLARYVITTAFPVTDGRFPASTLAINTSGSYVLGFALVLLIERLPPSRYARAFIAVGVRHPGSRDWARDEGIGARLPRPDPGAMMTGAKEVAQMPDSSGVQPPTEQSVSPPSPTQKSQSHRGKLEPGDGSRALVGLDGRGRVRVPPGVRHRLGLDGAVLVSVAVDRNVVVISPATRLDGLLEEL